MSLKELREAKLKAVADFRSHLESIQAENRAETAEDQERFSKIEAEIERLDKAVAREERAQKLTEELRGSAGRQVPPVDHRSAQDDDSDSDGKDGKGGKSSRSAQDDADFRATPEYEAAFRSFIQRGYDIPDVEFRALRQDNDAEGGYMVMSYSMMSGLIKFVDDATVVRQLATTFNCDVGKSMGKMSLDTDPDDFDWTSELGTGSEDSSMAFGKREFRPTALAKRIKISRQLLQNAPQAESLVQRRLGYKFGITLEKKFMTGNGASQPLGIFTASSDGISTSRDVNTGSTTAVTADSFIDCLYSLKPQYQATATWVMHRDVVKAARKLKTGAGDYLWQPSMTAGNPDMLLGKRIMQSEFAPNTFTNGNYAAVVGNFKFYYIAEPRQMSIQRLNELYAETNQVGFIARGGGDGQPVLEEAFARLKFAA